MSMKRGKGEVITYEDAPHTIKRPTEILAFKNLFIRVALARQAHLITSADIRILRMELAFLKTKRGIADEKEIIEHISMKLHITPARVEQTLNMISTRFLLEAMV